MVKICWCLAMVSSLSPGDLEFLITSANRCAHASHDPEIQVVAALLPVPRGGAITGVNRFPAGTPAWGKSPSRDFVNKRIIHAERDAIYKAAYYGVSTRGAELYSSLYPCAECANAIVEAGIRHVFTHPQPEMPEWQENWTVAEATFHDNGMQVHFVPNESITKIRA